MIDDRMNQPDPAAPVAGFTLLETAIWLRYVTALEAFDRDEHDLRQFRESWGTGLPSWVAA